MSSLTIAPATRGLRGRLAVPSDKSIAHRALLFGAVAAGTTTIHGFQGGRDNRATLAACRTLGVTIEEMEKLSASTGPDSRVSVLRPPRSIARTPEPRCAC